ncbi:MAG: SIMPL domain-containing protein [Spirochaetota bacterium]
MRKNSARILVVAVLGLALTGCITPNQMLERMETAVSSDRLIEVDGVGVVEAEPDTASIRVTVSELRETTQAAQSAANDKVSQVLEMAAKHGLEDSDITTEGLSISPEYERVDGKRELVGHRVRQTLALEIADVDTDTKRLGEIIDDLGTVSGIEISALSFYVEDTESLYTEARDLAFRKARQKAKELAGLGEVKLGSPVSITEQSQDTGVRTVGLQKNEMAMMADSSNTQIPAGSFSVRVNVRVSFPIETP